MKSEGATDSERRDGAAEAGEREARLIRVVVQSSEVWNRKGLARWFAPSQGFVLVRGKGAFEEVLSECERMAPCVLIADQVALDGLKPAEFGARISYGQSVQILVVGPQKDNSVVESLLRRGCKGFVTADAPSSTLKKAVRAVAIGEFWADRKLTSRVVQRLLLEQAGIELTPREKEILWLIGRGLKNREIGERLCIARETVRCHIRNVYSKIGIHDRLSAASFAQEHLTMEAEPLASNTEANSHGPDLPLGTG